jgi:glycosyltransferase involved in cell wall biosynthesis
VRASLSIAIVAPLVAPLSDAHPYGNQHFVCDLARGLRARGHEVVVYAAAGSQVPGVTVETFAVAPGAQRRFVLLRASGTAEADAMQRAFDGLFARLVRRGHDVVSQHAFDREAFAGCRGMRALHTLHLPPMRSDMVTAVRDCDNMLASVSHICAALWRSAVARPVLALPNGVPDFAPPVATAIDAVAIVAGRISREKGIAAAVRVARAAGLRPLIAGEIYDRDYFRDEVEPLLAGEPIVSTMPRRALAAAMARAAVTLMPIEWDEPFGLVAAEAQCAGCPVLGYRRGALPEVVPDGVGGFLVDPGDEVALVAAVERARSLDRARIRNSARRRFSMSACVRRHETALAQVACGDARCPTAAVPQLA